MSYLPIILKCPYCKRWFKVKTDLNSCISNINRHIGHSHPGEDKIRIEFVSPNLLAYIRVAPRQPGRKTTVPTNPLPQI